MDFEQLIGLADVKEAQAFAYTSVYNGKVSNEELQKGIDDYCENMAQSFMEQHKDLFADEKVRRQIRKHILNIGANNKHSGHRFYETLYSKLNDYEQKLRKDEPSME